MVRLRLHLARTPLTRRCAALLLLLVPLWWWWWATPDDAALSWLRRSRDASAYLRPGVSTVLLDGAAPCGDGVRLLLAVASSPGGGERRWAVRRTWGGALPAQTRLLFMLGHDGSRHVQEELRREAEEHGDVVVEDFVDNYHNLTLKTLFMLKWAAARCSSAAYVLKTDDDMLVNVRRILREAEARGDPGLAFLLGAAGCGLPQRSPRSKWHLPQWLYTPDTLPAFLTGAGYVMSQSAGQQLLKRAADEPLINLEDVYVTGLLAARPPAIPLLTAVGMRVERPPLLVHPCLLHHGYLVHGYSGQDLEVMWHRLQVLDTRSCGAAWLRCFTTLFSVHDYGVVQDAGWGP